MDYTNYIRAELLVLVVVLYGLGEVIKATGKIKNNYIPLILTIIGIALSALYVLSTEGVTGVGIFTAIVQGVLVAAVAVYGNQVIKQTTSKE